MYYAPQSDIRVKSYGCFNLPGASAINFERLNILWYAIRHSRQKLWQFEFDKSFYVQFRTS